ncbi:orotate phosphoribosyltransferase [Helicobacter saguini]|uniref:Orotate phosphoribosyltransferase n=1 Tax=Helicobacter saguini TaxID=1548018 RepID=A0A347VRN8_9HELI|nr:orotate phosphoribosyltransferase [Helicobacter saguini]MWV62834.1 orotate phosphoribosyltransferase [Helicobacter saguini]MWV66497.1 orotate phosphoribosyltransferase [Helicobacter saguini]MWV68846.1 orotate phosphoribosyltransferase [Helicobacter saguini]MWV71599.1 orotate phosphoribosyltransferase [Helicobacter saguini]TLD94405.1 orotate phosphoribosyltransferase [Helicobacter saguini]
MLDIERIYRENNALLQGHFLLSSGNHTGFYLQSAKVLENPRTAELLALELARQIKAYESLKGLKIDCVCSPALGGILAGYELARALNVRFIFTERVNGEMTLRRGFEIAKNENVLICEDIITTGGSAMESASCVRAAGGVVVGFAGLANRGFCRRVIMDSTNLDSKNTLESKNILDSKIESKGENHISYNMDESKSECKLTQGLPLFALADFNFEIFLPESCPLCKDSKYGKAYKPGSRNN